jgi:hypothetical protein
MVVFLGTVVESRSFSSHLLGAVLHPFISDFLGGIPKFLLPLDDRRVSLIVELSRKVVCLLYSRKSSIDTSVEQMLSSGVSRIFIGASNDTAKCAVLRLLITTLALCTNT